MNLLEDYSLIFPQMRPYYESGSTKLMESDLTIKFSGVHILIQKNDNVSITA